MKENIIHLENKEIVLRFDEYNDIDLNELLTIDYDELKETVSSFPLVLHQINTLFVEASDDLRSEEFNLDLVKDNIKAYKDRMYPICTKELKDLDIKSPTAAQIEAQITSKTDYSDLQDNLYEQRKKVNLAISNKEKLSSLYWSCKSKMEVLQNLSKGLVI